MCKIFDVCRSGYYDWLHRPESKHSQEDQRLAKIIIGEFNKARKVYGSRRLKNVLFDQGEKVSRYRIGRLMKSNNLHCKVKRKFKATTNSNHNLPIAPNLLERDFKVDSPDNTYVGDITYISTGEGWLYLAVFIDLFSRKVVGWAMSKRMTASLVNNAMLMAKWRRKPAKGLIVHSDRGSQYASKSFRRLLEKNQWKSSMSRKGDCWDNAPAESFFHTLKTELIYQEKYDTREDAKKAIFDYIEVFYNRQRKHSTIGYKTPAQVEENYREAA